MKRRSKRKGKKRRRRRREEGEYDQKVTWKSEKVTSWGC
jgi:hypothetical protein